VLPDLNPHQALGVPQLERFLRLFRLGVADLAEHHVPVLVGVAQRHQLELLGAEVGFSVDVVHAFEVSPHMSGTTRERERGRKDHQSGNERALLHGALLWVDHPLSDDV